MLPRSPSPLSDLTGTQVAARFTYAGVSPAPTRAGLEVQPASTAARRAANRAGARWLRTHTPHATTTRTAGLTAWREATATLASGHRRHLAPERERGESCCSLGPRQGRAQGVPRPELDGPK